MTVENNSLILQELIMLASSHPISGRVDRASSTQEVDPGSIPGLVKLKSEKFVIQSFLA